LAGNRQTILFFVFLAGLGILSVSLSWLKKPAYFLARERIRIPETDLTIQILEGYQYFQNSGLNISKDLLNLSSTPTFHFRREGYTDTYRSYQTPADVLPRIFSQDFETPEVRIINGIQVYLSRYIGNNSAHTRVVLALLFYENIYVSFYAWGLPSEIEPIYTMVETMLLSLQVEPDN